MDPADWEQQYGATAGVSSVMGVPKAIGAISYLDEKAVNDECLDFRAALDFMQEHYTGRPLWAAGMSFGAWIALTEGAGDPRVSALIGIAVPVDRYDFEPVGATTTPKFFIHGERDEVTSVKAIRAFYARAADPKELVVIDAADHVFNGKAGEVGDALEDLLGDWPG